MTSGSRSTSRSCPTTIGSGPERVYANSAAWRTRRSTSRSPSVKCMPLSEKEIRDAEADHIVRAPVKARIVMPVQFVPDTDRRAAGEPANFLRIARAAAGAAGSRQGPGPLRAASVKSREVARRIFDALERHYPDADTELAYRTPFELLVATILSAQSTDQRVNLVTPALFRRYPDARALAAAEPEDLEPIILSTGFFRQKSRSIVGMAQALVEHHGGEVPADMEALVKLPGVGRKTANVVLGHALGVPACRSIATCCASRTGSGWCTATIPRRSRRRCAQLLPPERWTKASDTADPARAAHLPADAAVPALQRAQGLRLLPPAGVVTRAGRARKRKAQAASPTAKARADATRPQGPRRPGDQEAMTREQFKALVEEAIDTIPRRFAREVRNVAIVIEDGRQPSSLAEMEIEPGRRSCSVSIRACRSPSAVGPRQHAPRSHHALSTRRSRRSAKTTKTRSSSPSARR